MSDDYSSGAVLEALNVKGYKSLADAFADSADTYSDRIAYSCMGVDMDFATFAHMARAFSSFLTNDLGLKKGDRIAVQLPNIPQYPIAAWGAILAGVILVNTNPLYTERELLHQFNDSGAIAWVTLPTDLGLIDRIRDNTEIKHVIFVSIPGIDAVALAADKDWATPAEHALAAGMAHAFNAADLTMDDIAVLQFTGGTTGLSKGAILTHGNLFSSMRMAEEVLDLSSIPKEIIIAPMPVYHVYGFTVNIIGALLRGGQSVLVPDPRDLDSLIKTMASYPFTSMAGINTLYAGILQHPDLDTIDFSHVQGVIAGGAALMTDIAEAWVAKTGSTIIEGYGLSETSSNLCCNKPDSNRLGTVGKHLTGMQVKCIDGEGNDVTDGSPGELCVRGPHVMSGYWQKPEATAEAIDAEGWFKTGDVAVIEDDGFVRIVDRIKDMIIVSGFNVYPNEIEDVVSTHPRVIECAVIGVPDERTGEGIALYIVAITADVTADEIEAHCRQSLTAYKIPRDIHFIEELPKSAVGKILRRELRDQMAG